VTLKKDLRNTLQITEINLNPSAKQKPEVKNEIFKALLKRIEILLEKDYKSIENLVEKVDLEKKMQNSKELLRYIE
jgi:hypothetical protein